jgi:hypothetical protein
MDGSTPESASALSPVLYVVAIVATLWSPWMAEAIFVTVALIWLIPDRRIENMLPRRA